MRALLVLTIALLTACGGQPAQPAQPAPSLPPSALDTPVDLPYRSPYGHPAQPEALADLLTDTLGPDVLRVHMIDIGQGDALLIEAPGGKRILLDAGPRTARKALLDYLGRLGVRRLDMVVASHAHSDHIANMDVAINRLRPGVLLDSGLPHTTRDYTRMLDAVEHHKVKLRLARKGRQITLGQGVVLHLLGPEEPLIKNSRSDLNANSVVFRLEYDQFSMLFTGDAEEVTEQRLLKDPESLAATVLKVAHHGSAHASTPAFLKAVKPRIAVVSAARKNRYGHPAPEAMQRLTAAGATLFDTPRHGHIVLSTDGKKLQIHTQKAPKPISLAPQGQTQSAALRAPQSRSEPL